MSVNDLAQFLRAAKSATYAAQGDGTSVAPLLQDSKQLEYRKGEYFYRDIYVGMFRFVGQEIIYLCDRAIWSMSYSGGLINGTPPASAKAVYAALRQALLNSPPLLPIRGPASFKTDNMLYECNCKGALESFHGVESIAQNGVIKYQLQFAGGSLA